MHVKLITGVTLIELELTNSDRSGTGNYLCIWVLISFLGLIVFKIMPSFLDLSFNTERYSYIKEKMTH